jgi:hypothetical protein
MANETRRFEGYLVVKKSRTYWQPLQGRLTAKRPGRLLKGEVPVRLVIEVPVALFEEPPLLELRGEAHMNAGQAAIEAALDAAGLDVVVVRETAPATGEVDVDR